MAFTQSEKESFGFLASNKMVCPRHEHPDTQPIKCPEKRVNWTYILNIHFVRACEWVLSCMRECMYVCVCAWACVRVSIFLYERVCVYVCVCAWALNNTLAPLFFLSLYPSLYPCPFPSPLSLSLSLTFSRVRARHASLSISLSFSLPLSLSLCPSLSSLSPSPPLCLFILLPVCIWVGLSLTLALFLSLDLSLVLSIFHTNSSADPTRSLTHPHPCAQNCTLVPVTAHVTNFC